MNKKNFLVIALVLLISVVNKYAYGGGELEKAENTFFISSGPNISAGNLNGTCGHGFSIGIYELIQRKENFAFKLGFEYTQSGNSVIVEEIYPYSKYAYFKYTDLFFRDVRVNFGFRSYLFPHSDYRSLNLYAGVDVGYSCGVEVHRATTKIHEWDDYGQSSSFHSTIFFSPNLGAIYDFKNELSISLDLARRVGMGRDVYHDSYRETDVFYLDFWGYYHINLGLGIKL